MIIKFKIFETYRENDPFDEEDWNDENQDFKKGDRVLCIKGTEPDSGGPIQGQEYIVVYICEYDPLMDVKTIDGDDIGEWFRERFVKVRTVNENDHFDIDPLGEEDWNDMPMRVRILPNMENYIQPKGLWNKLYIDFIGREFDVRREEVFENVDCYVVGSYNDGQYELHLIPKECVENTD
jgi:hypothetical protein